MSENQDLIIMLTNAAINKVKDHAKLHKEVQDKFFRVAVTPGGCSGYEYSFSFDHKKEGDIINRFDDIEVLVDQASVNYIEGCVVDYEDGLVKSGFTVNNPHAMSSCGCGSSFGV